MLNLIPKGWDVTAPSSGEDILSPFQNLHRVITTAQPANLIGASDLSSSQLMMTLAVLGVLLLLFGNKLMRVLLFVGAVVVGAMYTVTSPIEATFASQAGLYAVAFLLGLVAGVVALGMYSHVKWLVAVAVAYSAVFVLWGALFSVLQVIAVVKS